MEEMGGTKRRRVLKKEPHVSIVAAVNDLAPLQQHLQGRLDSPPQLCLTRARELPPGMPQHLLFGDELTNARGGNRKLRAVL